MRKFVDVMVIYEGSNGDATKAMYNDLQALGPVGIIAMNLFRAQKCSARAKLYRRGGYKGLAYDRKSWSLGLLCEALAQYSNLGITWGWGTDDALKARGEENYHVLYLDLPTGQVSFHNGSRKAGPDYSGKWDGVPRASPERVCRFVADVFTGKVKSINPKEITNG